MRGGDQGGGQQEAADQAPQAAPAGARRGQADQLGGPDIVGNLAGKMLDARRVAILPAGAATPRGGGIAVVAEMDDGAAGLFGRRSDAILLLRPEHYVAAAFTLADVDETAAAIQPAAHFAQMARLRQRRCGLGAPRPEPGQAFLTL